MGQALFRSFEFIAETRDGKILEFPEVYIFQCEKARPLGFDIVRQFNKTECIVAKKVLLVFYQGHVFGTTRFAGVADFINYMNNVCKPFCTPDYFTINGCNMRLNGCNARMFFPCPERTLTLYGCGLRINGCELRLN